MTKTRKTLNFSCNTDPKLLELLAKARDHVMTAEEKEAQRMSWVIGELMLSDSSLTREKAIERYKRARDVS